MLKWLRLLPLAALAACSTTAEPSGVLSNSEGLVRREGALRTGVAERKDEAALAVLAAVRLAPAQLAAGPATDWLTPAERALLLREVDAQLCFELSERYDIVAEETPGAGRVRAVVTAVRPTGRLGSAAAAAAGFFIPGPIGVRAPGTLGGLTVEAELLADDGRQLAALVWNRTATAVGTDDPSLSRIGDALQFAEPFADTASQVLAADSRRARAVPQPDPCRAYGPRFRPEGRLASFLTNLYVPQMSGARAAEAQPEADGAPAP